MVSQLFLMVSPPKGTLQLAVFRPFLRLALVSDTLRIDFPHFAETMTSAHGDKPFNPRHQILHDTTSNSSRHGIKFFTTRHQILRDTDKNFFCGLEIYFKALEIYFSASEIYFKATEIVLSRAEKKFVACRKEFWGTG